MMAAPLLNWRFPFGWTPRVFSLSLVYFSGVNFAFVYLVFNLPSSKFAEADQEDFDESLAFTMLSITTAIMVIGGVCTFLLIPQSVRHTFYRQQTAKEYYRDIVWNQEKFTSKDGRVLDLEQIRFFLPRGFSHHYWPIELSRKWYKKVLPEYRDTPPMWLKNLYEMDNR